MKKSIIPVLVILTVLLLVGSAHATNIFSAPDWTLFNFAGSPYGSNGVRMDGYGCSGALTGNCQVNGTYDLDAVWVSQSPTHLSFKIIGENLTGARSCGGTNDLYFQIGFNADGNSSSGTTEGGFQGIDYQLRINLSTQPNVIPNATFHNPFPAGSNFFGFNNTPNSTVNGGVQLFVNHTNCVNVTRPSSVLIALNKTAVPGWRTLEISVESKNGTTFENLPYDTIGKNANDSSANLQFFEGDRGFMNTFGSAGCWLFSSNQAGCTSSSTNSTVNNISCVYDPFVNECRPDFTDASAYGCDQFCGGCTTSDACTSGNNGQCIWRADASFCEEDYSKFQVGGDCSSNCFDCWGQTACESSSKSGGCSWGSDPFSGNQFCVDTGSKPVVCGIPSDNTTCSTCATQESCDVLANTSCGWDSAGNFCFDNRSGAEICFNGVDDNGDGAVDCNDNWCNSDPFCGGNYDNELLTLGNEERTVLEGQGICNAATGECDKQLYSQNKFFRHVRPGPPTILDVVDAPNTLNPVNEPAQGHVDIIGMAIMDMDTAYGLGIALSSAANLSMCYSGPGVAEANYSGHYYYYLDTDDDVNTGCFDANVSASNINMSGFEFKFQYNVTYNGSGANITRNTYRCVTQNSSAWGLFPATFFTPSPPGEFNSSPVCAYNTIMNAIDLKDIGNPTGSMRFSLAAVLNGTTLDSANDTLENASFTPGTMDFVPPDCANNPFACGSKYAKIGGGRFMPFEDCALGSGDEDQDGSTNCGDTDCIDAPWCAFNRTQLVTALSSSAPRVLVNSVDTFGTFAFWHQSTDQPTNVTFRWYGNSANCNNATPAYFTDMDARFARRQEDGFKPWHDMPLDPITVGALSAETQYFYRTDNCGVANPSTGKQKCATSACLNFTTSTSGTDSISFGFHFQPPVNDLMLPGMDLQYYNGSDYISFNTTGAASVTALTNTTLRFDTPGAQVGDVNKSWRLELLGADLTKAATINLTGAVSSVNDSDGNSYVGMNGTRWQEIAQTLGVDKIRINISETGGELRKCDENGKNCQDVTANATLIEKTANYSVWEVSTYGAGGFSTYTVTAGNSTVVSDRQLYYAVGITPIAYVNVTNTNASLDGIWNLTVNVTSELGQVLYEIQVLNNSNTSQWYNVSNAANKTAFTNYNFNQTTHQFRINVTQSSANYGFGRWNVTFSFNDTTTLVIDPIWTGGLNLTADPADFNVTTGGSQVFSSNFTLFDNNDTTQTCELYVNGTSYAINTSVINNSWTVLTVNTSLVHGNYTWYTQCQNSILSENGTSATRTLFINDTTAPRVSLLNPGNGSINVDSTTFTLQVNFSEEMRPEYINLTNFYVEVSGGPTLTFTNSTTDNKTWTISSAGFSTGTTYLVHTIGGATGLRDFGENQLTTTNFTFSTAASSNSGASSGTGGGGGSGSSTAADAPTISLESDTTIASEVESVAAEINVKSGSVAAVAKTSLAAGEYINIKLELPVVTTETVVTDGKETVVISNTGTSAIESHSVKALETTATYAKLRITSDPQEVTVLRTMPAFVDLNGDFIVDMRIDYLGYTDGVADLRFVSFKTEAKESTRTVAADSEPVVPGAMEEPAVAVTSEPVADTGVVAAESSGLSGTLLAAVVVLLLVLGGGYFMYTKKR